MRQDGPVSPSPPAVGNDVVDLTHPRCRGRVEDARFLRRILTDREASAVRGAEDPDLALWRRWAAKEAAFKAVSAVLGEPPVFEHAAFEVEESAPGRGRVRWRDLALDWTASGEQGEGWVHVVAWPEGSARRLRLEGGCARLDAVEAIPPDRFTRRELRAIHSVPSARVRLRARAQLAALTGVPEDELEIVSPEGPPGRTPPRVLRSGRPWTWRIGLSHHGGLLAWVLARWVDGGDPERPLVAPVLEP